MYGGGNAKLLAGVMKKGGHDFPFDGRYRSPL